VRELAALLGVNMHTVHRAYRELKDQGVVVMHLGRKVRVAPRPRAARPREEDVARLKEAIRRLGVEAYHCGLSKEEFLRLISTALEAEDQKPKEG